MMLDGAKISEDAAAALFQLDSVDGDAYLRTFRRREFMEPEKKLMLAVLEDALFCLERYFRVQSRRRQRRYLETEDWVFRADDGDPFSFDNVCEVLGLQPSYVRKGVLQWKQHRLEGAAKNSAGNVSLPVAAPSFVFKRAPRRATGSSLF